MRYCAKAAVAFALASLALTQSGCGNECSFFERCDGNTREVCGDGVDQQVGRKIRRFECDAVNPTCVQADDHTAVCVRDPATTCDPATFAGSCDGNVAVGCTRAVGDLSSADANYVSGEDCGAKTCTVSGNSASCM